MSELKTVIQLHSIRVTSLTNPHDDLPGDLKMFAQFIIEENIFVQTLPVGSEQDPNSWKLEFGCNIPAHAPNFSVAVLRQSETEGKRLVGHVEIGRGEVLGSVESNRCTLQLQLNKVNSDGPSLNFRAGFSVSELPYQEVAGLDHMDMPENTIASVKDRGIASELQKMYKDSKKTEFSMDALQLRVIHERILLCCQSNGKRARLLNVLGDIFRSYYQASGAVDGLNQAVCAYSDAVRDNPEDFVYLADLGTALLRRFERLGDLDNLNQSVLRLEAAVALTPESHPDKPSQLSNLGNSLLCRFERLSDLDDLTQSVFRLEAAAALTPDGHPDKASWVNNLGTALLRRFERLGDLDDLNQSELRLEAAVALTPDGHPDKPSLLSNLGNSLLRHFERLSDLDDLTQSVLRLEAAVALTPDSHPDKASRLNNLGNSLLSRFKRLGDLDALNQSVLRSEAAVALTPDGHPDKASHLNNLRISLCSRFKRLGDLDDLNQSVLTLEAGVSLAPDGHPSKSSMLNNLGISLRSRFERHSDLDDLNRSVLRSEAGVSLTPDGHSEKPSWLSNLGGSLLRRFERLGDPDDLNQSVLRVEAALALTPDGHSEKPSQLSNLGGSLLRRFDRLSAFDDLNQSVLRLEAALALTPDGHPDKPLQLSRLGSSLWRRFERLGDLDDLNQSVLRSKAAVALTPDGHPDKPLQLFNLGIVLLSRFKHLDDPQDALQGVLHYTSAACSAPGPATIRFHAATITAIELLPELAWLGLSIRDRHHHLSEAGQVVRDAASAAIAAHDYQKAVEWLEQGHSVIWGQLLNLRTPLVSLSTSLQTAGTQKNAVSEAIKPQSLQSASQQSHAFALERSHVLQQIRELPGFERFLVSKAISELSLASKMGPVAILNISAYGTDALILVPGLGDEVIHVPLHDFTLHEAQDLAESLASIVGNTGRTDRFSVSRERDMTPDEIFSFILSELWSKIVQPVLNGIAITTPASQDLGRIWWCPTGPLVFLPIHAAGLYEPRLLAVSQPSAQGQSHIPVTQEEIKCIQTHLAGRVPVQWLDKDMAAIDTVQQGMKDSSWVHFACHGVQSTSPTESALLLAGRSRLTLSNIINLSLPNADLAFLSACQTDTGSKELQDESVHLAAGMLLAGYRGVIGMMWSIGDNDAPQVAGDVYAHLLEVLPPDSTRAAEALHLAVRKLQEQLGAKKSFLRWVPFIHFGV
ncbi:CHAT domain-containing protein [Mycena sanguinolenta]|nr:CHAT domain-containing protein [Mycena sanguinolenta]